MAANLYSFNKNYRRPDQSHGPESGQRHSQTSQEFCEVKRHFVKIGNLFRFDVSLTLKKLTSNLLNFA